MNVGIIGAGAIGGWVGSKLAAAGDSVSFLARGQTLKELRSKGIGFQDGDTVHYYQCIASDDAEELGVQDLLVIAVKGPSLPNIVKSLSQMIGPNTLILPMLNGVPWWFMPDGAQLNSIDPDGSIGRAFPRENTLGCVIYAGAGSPDKAVSKLHFLNRIILGELDGTMSTRLNNLVEHFTNAGLTSIANDDIRSAIWSKLLGNMTLNPMSALTLATLDKLSEDPFIRELIKSVREEAKQVGERIDCSMKQANTERKKVATMLTGFKSSMLQDVEAGRPVELDALLAAPIEIAEQVGIDVPNMRGLFGLARMMAKSRGLY